MLSGKLVGVVAVRGTLLGVFVAVLVGVFGIIERLLAILVETDIQLVFAAQVVLFLDGEHAITFPFGEFIALTHEVWVTERVGEVEHVAHLAVGRLEELVVFLHVDESPVALVDVLTCREGSLGFYAVRVGCRLGVVPAAAVVLQAVAIHAFLAGL